eukprot:CAMPEP_0197827442 /NCGR_PEP_ID=MMETSP1437-20131217/4207_1 /TAXON_ID=49252 ORGANISM="Eucampia antarctica, Strain CCMP1452" /NCGR_SAMPLE_ID=MMETSP1437 /ASSEMBLY_ACC=CAM_ASM_001096 /LENGTH=370 /DNA_ID=CAMNT_0043428273 /DNA_START=118 /DNA_END=1230 /DNA_ORIENTATION=+
MVRHHVKKKKSKKTLSPQETLERQQQQTQAKKDELNRFAGSSEEEDGNDNDADEDEDSGQDTSPPISETRVIQSSPSKKRKAPTKSNDDESNNDDDEEGDDAGYSSAESSSDEGDDDEYDVDNSGGPMFLSPDAENAIHRPHLTKNALPQAGMGGAMSRILGGPSASAKPTESRNVVLSKTKTPLQKLQLKEKQQRLEAKEQRKERRSERLTCMHVPLLAATTFQMTDSNKSMSQELELERMHRRVATRGVVALFNAITQHQQNQTTQQLQSKDDEVKIKKKKEIQNISKKGFLDMIKNKGVSKAEDGKPSPTKDDEEKASKQNLNAKPSSSSGWNALKDDFMMNSKLKDWDKDMSSSSEEEDDEKEGEK